VSSITLAEMVYLVEKGRIPAHAVTQLTAMLDLASSILVDVPFDRAIAEALPRIDRAQVPDFPDRLITATALVFGVPLISRDAKIRVSGVATIW